MADETDTQCSKRTEDWNMLSWKDVQKNVFRLQRRNLRERYAFLGREPRHKVSMTKARILKSHVRGKLSRVVREWRRGRRLPRRP
jgi:hypothetical protein